MEFGGTVGAFTIMIFSHLLLYGMSSTLYGLEWNDYMPTKTTWIITLGYHITQIIFAAIMPGVYVKGMSGLGYHCNGYVTFYATIGLALLMHYNNTLDLTILVDDYPRFLTVTVLLGNLYSMMLYASVTDKTYTLYEYFIGGILHPRIGNIDIKMLLETRLSWTWLFLITIGGYIKNVEQYGWMNPSLYMLLAHWLYANACAKGEHFIPYTWDIFHEKLGWMLCFWNVSGVPMLYCYQTLYLSKNYVEMPVEWWCAITFILIIAYCIWDQCNYQKNLYKCMEREEVIDRNLFPTFRGLPKNPKVLTCSKGKLLIDGWYAYGRKIHYMADTVMALCWGLCCGFNSFFPYVYVIFFGSMIIHRAFRDEDRCSKKYHEIWDKYLEIVPYRFIPGIF